MGAERGGGVLIIIIRHIHAYDNNVVVVVVVVVVFVVVVVALCRGRSRRRGIIFNLKKTACVGTYHLPVSSAAVVVVVVVVGAGFSARVFRTRRFMRSRLPGDFALASIETVVVVAANVTRTRDADTLVL